MKAIAFCFALLALSYVSADESVTSPTTIVRDEWGVPHIHGRTHADAFFGMGYAQAEDYFWQLEDTCIQAVGRYAEVMGEEGVRSDILNRSFEIVSRSRSDFEKMTPEHRSMAAAFVDGINHYLATHPEEKPRLIKKFEPWQIVAMDRHMLLYFIYRQVHIGKPQNRGPDDIAVAPNALHFEKRPSPSFSPAGELDSSSALSRMPEGRMRGPLVDSAPPAGFRSTSKPLTLTLSPSREEGTRATCFYAWDLPRLPETGFQNAIRAAIGSNAWAISGRKTKSGAAMLFINPHQPWYGMGQFYEAHVSSDEGLNFTGACFYGNPFPTIGHNEHLGWTYTVNEPDIADVWKVTFDDPQTPLNYQYNGGHRTATQWTEVLKVKRGDKLVDQQITFRKTHHGPIVRQESDNTYLAVQVAGLFNNNRVNQGWGMVMATNFEEWKAAISHCAIPMFNVVYADNADNIFYAYNGSIPKRDPDFDWTKPVDGSDPRTEWQGYHTFDELPQVLNPSSGYVQSCNSTPFTTTHIPADNPQSNDFPRYMIEDANVDMRRSKISRLMLKDADELTFEQLQQMSFDTRLYWAMTEIPKLAADYERLKETNPTLASEVAECWEHLLDWDCRSSIESTQTTLTVAWYEQLYGFGYPAETLYAEYAKDRLTWFVALKKAADKLTGLYGTWKRPWGDAHRLQRVADQPDVEHAGVGVNGFFNSLPCPGTPGPLGIIFTVYSSPEIPIVRPQRFAVVGGSYMAVVEFQDRVRTRSVMPFGSSGRRRSPHFFDQAKLYSAKKLKSAWFYADEVRRQATSTVRLPAAGAK